MSTTIHLAGGDITLHESESFNKARHRLNRAQKLMEDYALGNVSADDDFEPYHILSFRMDTDTEEGGRISVNVEKVIAISSDEPKDLGGGGE